MTTSTKLSELTVGEFLNLIEEVKVTDRRKIIFEMALELADSANSVQLEKICTGLEKIGMPIAARQIRMQLEVELKPQPKFTICKEYQQKRLTDAIFMQSGASFLNEN